MIYSVRWQQQVEWRMTGIDFAKTFGQRRPEDDMLSEESIIEYNNGMAHYYMLCHHVECFCGFNSRLVLVVVFSLKVGPAYRFTVASRLQCCMLQGIGELCRKVRINRQATISWPIIACYKGSGYVHLTHRLNHVMVRSFLHVECGCSLLSIHS